MYTIDEAKQHYLHFYLENLHQLGRGNASGKWPPEKMDAYRRNQVKLEGMAEVLGLTPEERKKLQAEVSPS